MRKTRPSGAGPVSPDQSQGGAVASSEDAAILLGWAAMRTAKVTTPAPINSQTISDAVQTVTPARTRNRSHARRLAPRVLFASFQALLAMMAITAAPTP